MSTHTAPRHHLTVEPGGMVIGNVSFPYDRIERLAYWTAVRRRNGAYLGRSFSIKLDDGERHAWAIEETNEHDDGLAAAHDRWAVAVGLLRSTVLPRLVIRSVDTIASGGRVRFGSYVADLRGLRALVTLAPPVAWDRIVGTSHDQGVMRLVVGRPDGTTKARLSIAPSGWNVPLLPEVIARFGGDPTRRIGPA